MDGIDERQLFAPRPENVMHMCPAEGCGLPANPFCTTCRGAGQVTDLELGVWQMRVNAEIPT